MKASKITRLGHCTNPHTRRALVIVVCTTLAGPVAAQLTVRNGSAADAAAAIRDQFRTDLGGGVVAGANGLFDDGVKQRREINWDGVPAAASAPNALSGNFFNSNSPRGAVFNTPGTGFQVSGAAGDAGVGQPAAANFGNIDPSYSAQFLQFSPQRLFTPIDSNIMEVTFFLPGTATPAGTRGFGLIFTGVEQAGTTLIQLFDLNNVSLGAFDTSPQPGSTGFSFLGAFMNNGQSEIGRVRITLGNTALGAGILDTVPLAATELVVMDDFIYGNPTLVPEGSTIAGAAMGSLCFGLLLVRRKIRASGSPAV